jgi:hypothetical protein
MIGPASLFGRLGVAAAGCPAMGPPRRRVLVRDVRGSSKPRLWPCCKQWRLRSSVLVSLRMELSGTITRLRPPHSCNLFCSSLDPAIQVRLRHGLGRCKPTLRTLRCSATSRKLDES